MRLRLNVKRHELPSVQVLWPLETTGRQGHYTVFNFLQAVNEVFPLESGQWGLESYIVELEGFECLHYSPLLELLKDDDHVTVRPLQTNEVRKRYLTGRTQVLSDGRRLLDGIAFGRPALRRSERPDLDIPSLEDSNGQAAEIDESTELTELSDAPVFAITYNEPDGLISEHGKSSGESPGQKGKSVRFDESSILSRDEGAVHYSYVDGFEDDEDDDGEDDDDEDDDDFESPSEDDSLSDEASEDDIPTESEKSTSNGAGPKNPVTLHQDYGLEHGNRKRKTTEVDTRPSKEDDDTSSTESSDDDSSEDDESSEDSSAEEEDSSENESPIEVSSKLSSALTIVKGRNGPRVGQKSPPFEGQARTRNRNRRRRVSQKLRWLKSRGDLPADASLKDVEALAMGATDLGDADRNNFSKQDESHGQAPRLRTRLTPPAFMPPQVSQKLRPSSKVQGTGAGGADTADPPQADLATAKASLLAALADEAYHGPDHPDKTINKPANSELSNVTAQRRSQLDVPSTKRLVFGSLGVRTPRTSEEVARVQQTLAGAGNRPASKKIKLAASNDQPGTALGAEQMTAPIQQAQDEHDPDFWRSRISLRAIECFEGQGTELDPPPFPFYQYWDKTCHPGKGRKRKRHGAAQFVPLEYEECSGYDEIQAYSDPTAEGNVPDEAAVQAWFTALPAVDFDELMDDCVIAYKQLEVSAATNWQPQMSDFRIASVSNVNADNATMVLRSIGDDTKNTPRPKYDNDGNRVYDKFEMPGLDDEDTTSEGNDGMTEVPWSQLSEVKLLQPIQRGEYDAVDASMGSALEVDPRDEHEAGGGSFEAKETGTNLESPLGAIGANAATESVGA